MDLIPWSGFSRFNTASTLSTPLFMTSLSPEPLSTPPMSPKQMSIGTASDQPVRWCGKCKKTLDATKFEQRYTTKFWTNCLDCREKETKRRRDKEAARLAAVTLKTNKAVTVVRKYSAHRTKPAEPLRLLHRQTSNGTMVAHEVKRAHRRKHRMEGPTSPSKIGSQTLQTAKHASPASSHPTELECSVCSDTFPADQFPRLQSCSHEPRVCSGCFANWLTSQVGSTSWDRIVCPSDGCGVLVTHGDMKTLATQDTYTR